MSEPDISGFRSNTKLEELRLEYSGCADGKVDFSQNTGLKILSLEGFWTHSGTLDLTHNTELTDLRIKHCFLSCLDLKSNLKLKEVVFDTYEGEASYITLDTEADGSYDLTKLLFK